MTRINAKTMRSFFIFGGMVACLLGHSFSVFATDEASETAGEDSSQMLSGWLLRFIRSEQVTDLNFDNRM